MLCFGFASNALCSLNVHTHPLEVQLKGVYPSTFFVFHCNSVPTRRGWSESPLTSAMLSASPDSCVLLFRSLF